MAICSSGKNDAKYIEQFIKIAEIIKEIGDKVYSFAFYALKEGKSFCDIIKTQTEIMMFTNKYKYVICDE